MHAVIRNKGRKKMMNMWQDINAISFCISDMNACSVISRLWKQSVLGENCLYTHSNTFWACIMEINYIASFFSKHVNGVAFGFIAEDESKCSCFLILYFNFFILYFKSWVWLRSGWNKIFMHLISVHHAQNKYVAFMYVLDTVGVLT